MRRLRLFPVALAVCSLALSACGGGGGDRPTLSSHPAKSAPTTTTTLPPYTSRIAEGATNGFVPFYDSPLSPQPSGALGNPWFVNGDPALAVKQVFLVEQQVDDWYQVLLPVRPNGTTGWIRAETVRVFTTNYHITVELSAHRITVYDGEAVILQEPVAIGAPFTPTPPGKYYLRVLLQAPNPRTVYGPYAYPLSGHSDVLTSFDGGDGELGIHGNNDASVLGSSVTHGCIRMSNDGITRLTKLLPLGTPVEIMP